MKSFSKESQDDSETRRQAVVLANIPFDAEMSKKLLSALMDVGREVGVRDFNRLRYAAGDEKRRIDSAPEHRQRVTPIGTSEGD
jgi:hypothetical protein